MDDRETNTDPVQFIEEEEVYVSKSTDDFVDKALVYERVDKTKPSQQT